MSKPYGAEREPQEQEEFASLEELDQDIDLEEGEEVVDDPSNSDQGGNPDGRVSGEDDPDVPEKYKGKSVEELIRMHQEAERLASRHGQELGDLRKHADEFIKRQLSGVTDKPEEKDDDVSFDDLVNDPAQAVKRIVNKDVEELNNKLSAYEKERTEEAFYRKHPEAVEVFSSPEFADFVGKSNYRIRLAQAADAYDIDAAEELLELYNTVNPKKEEPSDEEQEALEAKRKKHATSKASASASGTRKKKYRRADVIDLMQNDPERYKARLPEIKKAYAEGRVI
jgi:hypothetical protein